jgi:hypothetical protein
VGVKKRLYILLSAFSITSLALGINYVDRASATVPGVNTLVSVNNTGNGQGGNDDSYSGSNNYGSISADGRFVVFVSIASDLISGDTNGKTDAFVRDLSAGTTTRVDVSSSGAQANGSVASLSSNQRVAAISSTGRYVVFMSNSTNLIDGQTLPARYQIYMHDMQTGTTTLVSQLGGTPGDKSALKAYGVSSDGRFVLFGSAARNLGVTVPTSGEYLYRADLHSGTFQVLNIPLSSLASTQLAAMSCDGSLVIAGEGNDPLTADDTNTYNDVYLMDFRNGLTITNLSVTADHATFSPTISCNGDYIGFLSSSHVYAPTVISPSDTHTHAFVYDRINGTYTLADINYMGVAGNQDAVSFAAVDDKANMVFVSAATNLGVGITITTPQVWLHNTATNSTELLSRSTAGFPANNTASIPSISADGKLTSYGSYGSNLISSDTNAKGDIFTSQTGL